MTSHALVPADLADRLDRLEQQNRRWRMLALLALLLLAAVFLTGATSVDLPVPDTLRARTVEARTFVLRDAHGDVRARMALASDGARLTFYDDNGKVIASEPVTGGFQPLDIGPSR